MTGLPVFLAAHRTEAATAGAVAVAAAALYARRRKAAPATSAGGLSTIPGTVPAAAIVAPAATGIGGYDSSAFDAYNALQPEIDQILAQQQAATSGAGGGVTAPAPASSPILTNTDWESQAVEGWAQTGGAPLDLQTALGQYLAGQPINTAQASGVNWALSHYGVAPGGTAGQSPIVRA